MGLDLFCREVVSRIVRAFGEVFGIRWFFLATVNMSNKAVWLHDVLGVEGALHKGGSFSMSWEIKFICGFFLHYRLPDLRLCRFLCLSIRDSWSVQFFSIFLLLATKSTNLSYSNAIYIGLTCKTIIKWMVNWTEWNWSIQNIISIFVSICIVWITIDWFGWIRLIGPWIVISVIEVLILMKVIAIGVALIEISLLIWSIVVIVLRVALV